MTIIKIWKSLRLLAALLLTTFATTAPLSVAAQDRVIDKLPVLAGTTHIDHASPLLERNLQVFIKPSPLIDPDGPPPPIVYLLDADQTFPLMAAYSWSLTFSEEMPPSIIVGIGYGATNRAVNKRNTDYTAPGDNPQYGGADAFMDVLEKEIFPKVEELTGGDAKRRTLMGQSLGGQFVVHAALNRPGLVNLGIAVNPALHNNLPLFLDMLAKVDDTQKRQSLYISSADGDADRFRIPGRQFIAQIDAHKALPFCLKTDILIDHMHLTSMPRAFRNAMRWYRSGRSDCEKSPQP